MTRPVLTRVVALAMLAAGQSVQAQQAQQAQQAVQAPISPPADSLAPARAADRVLLLAAGTVAAATWNQTIGTPKAWRRTWHGYGARLGDQVGFAVLEEGLRAGIGTALPWRPVTGGCERARAGHALGTRVSAATRCALRRTLLAHDGAGRSRPNVPFLGAVVGASAVSLAWRPERADAAKGQLFVASRIGIVLAGTVAKQAWGAWRGR